MELQNILSDSNISTVIRLHSSAAYPTHRSPIFTPSFSASQRCLSAVESLVSLCTYVGSLSSTSSTATASHPTHPSSHSPPSPSSLLSKLGPPFAFSVWVAARVLLVHGSTIDHHVDPSIHVLVDTLREMGRWWEVANRYAELLTRVLQEYQESQSPGGGGAGGRGDDGGGPRDRERETPGSVKILADMRRCAFDLDFLISRQPCVGAGVANANATGAAATRPASVAPSSRTPGPSEFEYLDVFDFFNMPRLPVSMEGAGEGQAGAYGSAGEGMGLHEAGSNGGGGGAGNEFNITNFMVDASADWFKGQA